MLSLTKHEAALSQKSPPGGKACRSQFEDRPLVLTAESGGRVIVTAAGAAALAAGAAPGMALADARAVAPGLVSLPADPRADAALLDGIAAWCYRYTPWSAVEGRDGVWLDVTGCAHLFGGEAGLLATLRARLAGFGIETRSALADTPGAAWALSHYGGGGVVAPGGARAALADLPVAALRLGPAAAAGLTRLGLKRIGDLYALPRAPLTARFGAEVTMRLDQVLGGLAEPISPRRPVPRHRVRLAFPDPIGLAEDIAAGLHRLLHRLCERLDRAGRGCRRLELTLCRADGSTQGVAIGTAGPVRDAAHLARLFAERLGHLDPGFGVEAMILAAPVTEPLPPAQTGLAGPRHVRASPDPSAPSGAMRPLLDRLGNRLGFDRLVVLRARQSHLPEGAMRIVPATGAMADTAGDATAWPAGPRPAGPPRPLRLLARPELVEVETASSSPLSNSPSQGDLCKSRREMISRILRQAQDEENHQAPGEENHRRSGLILSLSKDAAALSQGSPQGGRGLNGCLNAVCACRSPCAFLWRRGRHRLRAAEGPERIAPEWWRADPAWAGGARDYWRVEDADGRRFWLFRETAPHRKDAPRWFLHGVFA